MRKAGKRDHLWTPGMISTPIKQRKISNNGKETRLTLKTKVGCDSREKAKETAANR